jgi:hypothetical protein
LTGKEVRKLRGRQFVAVKNRTNSEETISASQDSHKPKVQEQENEIDIKFEEQKGKVHKRTKAKIQVNNFLTEADEFVNEDGEEIEYFDGA